MKISDTIIGAIEDELSFVENLEEKLIEELTPLEKLPGNQMMPDMIGGLVKSHQTVMERCLELRRDSIRLNEWRLSLERLKSLAEASKPYEDFQWLQYE